MLAVNMKDRFIKIFILHKIWNKMIKHFLFQAMETFRLAETLCCWYLKKLSIAATVSITGDLPSGERKMTSSPNPNNVCEERHYSCSPSKRKSVSSTPTSSGSQSEHCSPSQKKQTHIFTGNHMSSENQPRRLNYTVDCSSCCENATSQQPVVSTSTPEKTTSNFQRSKSETRHVPSIDRRTFDHMYSNAFKRGKSVRD